MAQYISRFVPNYTAAVEPLRYLTHKNVRWEWGKKQQESFEHLKECLADSHSLSYIDVELPVEVIVDTSPVGLGTILTQRAEDGAKSVVAYMPVAHCQFMV